MPLRWLAAIAVGWGAALLVWLGAGQWSIVLLLGPPVYIAGDLAAATRRRRLQQVVDAAFADLVGTEVGGAEHFAGRDARVVRQRSRLAGLPPRLIDLRIVQMPDGVHYAVQAQTARARADTIRWHVTRLTDDEAARVVGDTPVCGATQI